MPANYDTKCNWNGLRFNKSYSSWLNDATFFDYYTRLKNLALSEFEWSLPKTCDSRFLELILFEFGHVLFFQDDLNKAFLTLQFTLQGPLNMYRIPINRRAFAVTGYNQTCNDLNSVIIWNNPLRQPTSLTVELYARKMTEIDRAIDVNIKAQKTPVLIKGTMEQQRALKTLYSKYDGNTPVIFGDNSFDTNQLGVLQTNAPESYVNLMIAKQRIWNEALTFVGVNNTNIDKKERMITDEVNANLDEIGRIKYSRLKERLAACDLINDLFAGQLKEPASVRFAQPIGGGDIVDVYDGSSGVVRNSGRENNTGTGITG